MAKGQPATGALATWRDRALAREGWRVLRLPAALVLRAPAEAVATVRAALRG